MRLLRELKRLERIIYPRFMWGLNDSPSLEDYCECSSVKVFLKKDHYCILAIHEDVTEIVDVASLRPLSLKEIFKLADFISANGEVFEMDARSDTSYRLFKYFLKRVELIHEESYLWEDELMYHIKFKKRGQS